MSDIAHEIGLTLPYEQALDATLAALESEGFGVLTRIDIHDAFRQKLDVEFRRYSILGACNPTLAHKALSSRPDAGMMLPCNVTVEDDGKGGSIVRIIDAEAMMTLAGMHDDPVLAAVGSEAGARLKRVAELLSGKTL